MKKLLFVLFVFLLTSAVCAEDVPTLTVMTYNSFAVSEELVTKFEAENNVKVQFLQMGSAPEVVTRAILTADAPVADVIIGFEKAQLDKVLANNILEPYDSPELAHVNQKFRLDSENRALPFNFGDICINYDTNWFEKNTLALPTDLDDLIKPEYNGLLAVQDPASSATGAAFLLATVAKYGEDGFIPYWQSLIQNGAEITPDWSTSYYTNFSGSAGMGPQPMVVSYTTSPAAEVIYADTSPEKAPTASLTADGMCVRSIEFCGILKNCAQPELAKKFIDAFLGKEWQEDLPLQLFVYPVNEEAEIPVEFEKYSQPAENPVDLDMRYVNENLDRWIQMWNEDVLSQY